MATEDTDAQLARLAEAAEAVKRHWIGPARRAIEVHAPEAEHVNIHPFARHLWHCADGDGLPDFSHGAGTI